MEDNKTREPQYQFLLSLREKEGLNRFGLMSSQVWRNDPRRLAFLLSRYKFVSKMFTGMNRVLEIGCADAFGTRIVRQEVPNVTAVDFDPIFIEDARDREDGKWPVEFKVHDLIEGPVEGEFDGGYALDVIEHIPVEHENAFVGNLVRSLVPHGAVILGCPSLESQAYASPPSKEGHVNCKDGSGLRELMSRFFHRVFVFSMNDEVVHTGFQPMAHYLLALGCNRKADLPDDARGI